MSIFVDKETRLIVQGISGNEGKFHTAQMIDYGTNVVGGVVPGRGGQTVLERPVYNTVSEAVDELLVTMGTRENELGCQGRANQVAQKEHRTEIAHVVEVVMRADDPTNRFCGDPMRGPTSRRSRPTLEQKGAPVVRETRIPTRAPRRMRDRSAAS